MDDKTVLFELKQLNARRIPKSWLKRNFKKKNETSMLHYNKNQSSLKFLNGVYSRTR